MTRFKPHRSEHGLLSIELMSCAASTVRRVGGRTGNIVALYLTLLCPLLSPAQIRFDEVGVQRGLRAYQMAAGMGGGAAAADYDNDGDIDIFVPTDLGYPDQLYRNDGAGQFTEMAADAGVASTARNRAALWLDYDGDGDLDLLVAGDCWHNQCTEQTTLRLYRQISSARFEDVTEQAGLFLQLLKGDASHLGGMCAGDINNDGWLDICVPFWDGMTALLLNNRDGTFSDISRSSGVGADQSLSWQVVMHDFNRDGWLDIFVSVDFSENRLWINQQDNTFVDGAAAAGAANDWNDMGVALGDYDNDGDFDLYVTNIAEDGMHNILLRNDSIGRTLSFVEVAEAAGVENGFWGWGATFLDADNDGRLDLAATNGFEPPPWRTDPARFFLNVGGQPVVFSDVSDQVGFNNTLFGSALLAFDYNRDGNLDLFQVSALGDPLLLLENQPSQPAKLNAYLTMRPRMLGPNTHAIGAVVRAVVGERSMSRLITAGTSFIGQEPAEAHFGVGQVSTVDSVTIEWPNGDETALFDVAADQILTVVYDLRGDPNCDDRIDAFDIEPFLTALFAPTEYERRYPHCDINRADVNRDGRIDPFDIPPLLDLLFGD